MGKSRNTVLITSTGLVGSNLLAVFKKNGFPAQETFYPAVETETGAPVDITDKDSLKRLFSQSNPDIAILSAALTNVEYCEGHPDEAQTINVEGARNVVEACKDTGCKLVFFSSDYVFDGKNGPYSETDTPRPICVYGKTKLEAEGLIQRHLKDFLIIRTTIVYGYEKVGKNFVYRLINTLKKGESIRVPQDQIGSPTYAGNLAEIVFDLVRKAKSGLYNVVGKDLLDRYRFSLEVCDCFGLQKDLVIPVSTEQLGQQAPRPLKAGLTIDKVSRESDVKVVGLKEGLARFKKELYGKASNTDNTQRQGFLS